MFYFFFLRLLFLWIITNSAVHNYPILQLDEPINTNTNNNTNNNEQQTGIPLRRTRPSQRALRIQKMRTNPIITHTNDNKGKL